MKIKITREHLIPGVIKYDFPEELSKNIVKKLNKIDEEKWEESMVGAGDLKKHIRSSKNLPLEQILPNESKDIKSYMYACVKDFCKYFDTEVFSDEGLNILKYEDYDKYDYHSDYGPNMDRTVSILIYLNPSEYQGGETHFKFFNYAVDPKNPCIVIFPSNYPYTHAAMPVTDGKKYIVVSWLNDKHKNMLAGHGEGCACSKE